LNEDHYLADDLLRQLMNVGEVDLLVGISPHPDAALVRQAAQSIEQAFLKYFIRQRAVIVSFNGGAVADGIVPVENELAREPVLPGARTIARVTAPLAGTASPGLALRTILASADLLHARACAVISPATSCITPEWAANLLRPVYKDDFDFVAPLYTRHKYQGLLARNLLYPMSRATLGCGIRELYSDDWGFSGRLAALSLGPDIWKEQAVLARPEAWMAMSAISSGSRLCQAYLGPKLPQPANAPVTDLVEVLRETVGSLFWYLDSHNPAWLAPHLRSVLHGRHRARAGVALDSRTRDLCRNQEPDAAGSQGVQV